MESDGLKTVRGNTQEFVHKMLELPIEPHNGPSKWFHIKNKNPQMLDGTSRRATYLVPYVPHVLEPSRVTFHKYWNFFQPLGHVRGNT